VVVVAVVVTDALAAVLTLIARGTEARAAAP